MTNLKFHKMEGAGNDFVVLDNRQYRFSLDEIIEFTPKLCTRRFGVGADGLLVLEEPQRDDVDYTMIYRNADGSDAGMCGNGARCLALFAARNGFKHSHRFNVHDNMYQAEVTKMDDRVRIHFPVEVQPETIQLDGIELIKADAATEHLVRFVDKESLEAEEQLVSTGRKLRYHEQVNPPGTNVNFVQYEEGETSINLQTYERGVENLTLACGTGALASAIATHFQSKTNSESASYEVSVKGGTLEVSFDFNEDTNTYHHLILTGPSHFVFEGSIFV
ncbi:diaminopimelate epimerase [Gracilimonas mengyeensis]|uniref:Diaminopimelate epimerase n=1 Tax=Gracilimonas mengyeensis TaxID=1302730 RepID=A0A521C5A1_9BACT|nr:diaminopimelate epimerase [Gracilimonas mengyeensis]SMO54525.1 diaminopimelate epimerase [Gracilimonas mengyeensis]